jgi:hypothetical protein
MTDYDDEDDELALPERYIERIEDAEKALKDEA